MKLMTIAVCAWLSVVATSSSGVSLFSGDIVTIQHAYRLNDRLRVGFVRPRATFGQGPAASKVKE